jgi:hypothetical protein
MKPGGVSLANGDEKRRCGGAPTKDIEKKADETMMGGQRQQHLVHQDDMLEVVNDTFTVQKVHGSRQPVPIQALCRLKVPSSTGNVGDSDHFFEGNDLNGSDDKNDVDVTHEERYEESTDHDQCPECPCHKVGLFLFVLDLLFFGGTLEEGHEISFLLRPVGRTL